MSAEARAKSKVLRIGIIQDGKIVQERLIKAKESVTIGESAKNTFVLSSSDFNQSEFTIFQAAGEVYNLNFSADMKGKISSNGAVVTLQKLQGDPAAKRSPTGWSIPLSIQDRGKIAVGSVTILFQFVAPPPVQAVKPMQAMDFRPRLMEDDDPVFLGFLAVWVALGVLLVIWVTFSERPEYRMEDLPDRFTRIAAPKEELPPIEPVEDDDALKIEDDSAKREEKPEEAPKEAKAKPKDAKEAAKAMDDTKKALLENNTTLAKLIASTGQSRSTIASAYNPDDGGLADLEASLAAGGGIVTDANDPGLKVAGGGRGEARDIGDLGASGTGSGSGVESIAVKVPQIQAGNAEMDELEGDSAGVRRVLKAKEGLIKACYANELKNNPNLAGRVEVSWFIEGGRATSILVTINTTGSDALATCIKRRVQTFDFPKEATGNMAVPYVFSASQ